MKHLPICVGLLLLCVALAYAQSPAIEYGSADDLKGVKRVFVDTGLDLDVRKNILKEIDKSKAKIPDLEIVSRPEDAEVILVFGASTNTYLAGVNTTPTYGGGATSYPVYRSSVTGGGVVLEPMGENRVRVLMSFKDTRTSRFERRPSTNFAREFIHAYMKANGIQK